MGSGAGRMPPRPHSPAKPGGSCALSTLCATATALPHLCPTWTSSPPAPQLLLPVVRSLPPPPGCPRHPLPGLLRSLHGATPATHAP